MKFPKLPLAVWALTGWILFVVIGNIVLTVQGG